MSMIRSIFQAVIAVGFVGGLGLLFAGGSLGIAIFETINASSTSRSDNSTVYVDLQSCMVLEVSDSDTLVCSLQLHEGFVVICKQETGYRSTILPITGN